MTLQFSTRKFGIIKKKEANTDFVSKNNNLTFCSVWKKKLARGKHSITTPSPWEVKWSVLNLKKNIYIFLVAFYLGSKTKQKTKNEKKEKLVSNQQMLRGDNPTYKKIDVLSKEHFKYVIFQTIFFFMTLKQVISRYKGNCFQNIFVLNAVRNISNKMVSNSRKGQFF